MVDFEPNTLQLHPPVIQLEPERPPSSAPSVPAHRASSPSSHPSAPPPAASSNGAIPMSMPSILRNPQLKHLNRLPVRSGTGPASASSSSTGGGVGTAPSRPHRDLSKRKARRAENARLAGNPHLVRPTAADFRLHANPRSSTFPPASYAATTPTHRPTSLPLPAFGSVRAAEPRYDPETASSGQFRMSLRDARRVLSERINVDRQRADGQADGPVERTVWKAEREIRAWLDETVFVAPDVRQRGGGTVLVDREYNVVERQRQPDGRAADTNTDTDADTAAAAAQVVELQRTSNALVWAVPDPFLRLAVHCLARLYGCPSFSKDASASPSSSSRNPSDPAMGAETAMRHTWILNPNPLARGSRRPRRRSARPAAPLDLDVRRRSDSLSTVASASTSASTDVLGGPGLGPHATRPIVLAGGIETPPTTDLDSHAGSVRAWETEGDGDTTDPDEPDGLFSSGSAAGVGRAAGEGARATARGEEDAASDLSGSEADGPLRVERKVRRWARQSEMHLHRMETPLERSEGEADGDEDDSEQEGDVTLLPLREGESKGVVERSDDGDGWKRKSVSGSLLVRRTGREEVRVDERDGESGGTESDWAADREDAGESATESEAEAEVDSLAGGVGGMGLQSR